MTPNLHMRIHRSHRVAMAAGAITLTLGGWAFPSFALDSSTPASSSSPAQPSWSSPGEVVLGEAWSTTSTSELPIPTTTMVELTTDTPALAATPSTTAPTPHPADVSAPALVLSAPAAATVDDIVAAAVAPSVDGQADAAFDSATDVVQCTDAAGLTVRMGRKQAAGTSCPDSLANVTPDTAMAGFVCPTPEEAAETPILGIIGKAEGCDLP